MKNSYIHCFVSSVQLCCICISTSTEIFQVQIEGLLIILDLISKQKCIIVFSHLVFLISMLNQWHYINMCIFFTNFACLLLIFPRKRIWFHHWVTTLAMNLILIAQNSQPWYVDIQVQYPQSTQSPMYFISSVGWLFKCPK